MTSFLFGGNLLTTYNNSIVNKLLGNTHVYQVKCTPHLPLSSQITCASDLIQRAKTLGLEGKSLSILPL